MTSCQKITQRTHKKRHNHSSAQINQHMEENRIANLSRLTVNISKKAAESKSIEKLIQISVHKAKQDPGEENGKFLSVADDPVNQKFAEQQFLPITTVRKVRNIFPS